MGQQEPDQEATQHTRRGVALYESNPFLPQLGVKSRTRRVANRRGNMMLVNTETGEIQSQIAGFWESEEVDPAQFVKLFINGVKALAELSNAGTRVFELLYNEMQRNVGKDSVYLSWTAIKHHSNISKTVYFRGLSELIEKKFIAPQLGVGLYWVNPDFLWNGDRIAFVKEYRKKGADPRQGTLDLMEPSDPEALEG